MEQNEIDLKAYMHILKKRLLLIILITLLFSFASAVISYFVIKPTYTANISVIIGKDSSSDETVSTSSYNDLMLYQKSVKTYVVLAKSRKVAEDVITKLKLDMTPDALVGMISASANSDTEFLTLTVSSKDAQQSVAIANQLAKSLKTIGKDIKKVDVVNLVDDAQLPSAPSNPKPLLNISIAFVLGLMVSAGLVFLLEYLDNTVKSQEELEKLLEIPVIGLIPFVDEK